MKNKIYLLPFSKNFIQYISELLHTKNKGEDFGEFIVVFPGRRPSIYLKKYLQELLNSPFIPPSTFSMDEFVRFIFNRIHPDFKQGNNLDFAWFLYKCNINNELQLLERESNFSKFLPFALSLIRSIDELDMELVPDDKLRSVRYIHGIAHATSIDSLYKIKKKLRDYFLATKTTSRGFTYWSAASEIEKVNFNEFKEIYFCGHFALTTSEIEIVKHLIEKYSATFYTQMEENYPQLFKKVMDKLNAEPVFPEKQEELKRTFRYYSAPDIHMEVQKAGECLLTKCETPSDTAVVLPDDSCLVPFLNCVLTRTTFDFNVTMGFPISRTTHYNLIESIITAQQNRTEDGYYARDYLNVILNPYLKNIGVNGNYRASQLLNNKIEELVIKRRITFVKPENIENGVITDGSDIYTETIKILERAEAPDNSIQINGLNDFLHNVIHKHFFKNYENINTLNSFVNTLKESFLLIVNSEKSLSYPLSRDIFKKLFEYLETLTELTFADEEIDAKEIFQIVLKTLKQERIPFEGYPLKGLQILGLLETRNLQFKNVLFLNLNEGIVPAIDKYDPFLSIPLRKDLNLPTHIENEEIYRYHFKRLINGCKNAHIFYIQNDESIRSRFVEELIWEQQKKERKLEEMDTEEIVIDTVITPFSSPEVRKDSLTLEKIHKKITEDGLSPTAIDRYMNCPLSFYYYYVLGLEEKESLIQEINAKDIGSLVHKILEKFFTLFRGKSVTINEKIHKKELDNIIEHTFTEFFTYGNKGELYLLKKIVQFRLDKFFYKLLKTYNSPLKILKTEEKLSAKFQVNENINVKLTGNIDRIEKRDDNYVIIDYKTGEVDSIKFSSKRLLEIAKPLNREEAKKFIKSFQIPVYLYLLSNDTGEKDWNKLNAIIYDIKENEEKTLFSNKDDASELMERIILPTLRNIVSEIIKPDVPFFKDNSREKGCIFCPFPALCRKI